MAWVGFWTMFNEQGNLIDSIATYLCYFGWLWQIQNLRRAGLSTIEGDFAFFQWPLYHEKPNQTLIVFFSKHFFPQSVHKLRTITFWKFWDFITLKSLWRRKGWVLWKSHRIFGWCAAALDTARIDKVCTFTSAIDGGRANCDVLSQRAKLCSILLVVL